MNLAKPFQLRIFDDILWYFIRMILVLVTPGHLTVVNILNPTLMILFWL